MNKSEIKEAIENIKYNKIVYALKHRENIIYIGKTSNPKLRLTKHFVYRDSHIVLPKKQVSFDVLWYGDNDDDMYHQEQDLIRIHRPKKNINNNIDNLLYRLSYDIKAIRLELDYFNAEDIDRLNDIDLKIKL